MDPIWVHRETLEAFRRDWPMPVEIFVERGIIRLYDDRKEEQCRKTVMAPSPTEPSEHGEKGAPVPGIPGR